MGKTNPLSADDRLAIIDVIGRWSHFADRGDASAFDTVITDDASYAVGADTPVRGRDAVVSAAMARVADEQPRRHVRNTIFVEGDGDRALTRSYYLLTVSPDGGRPRPQASGVYEDELVRTPDGWRINRRVARPDGNSGPEPRA